MEVRKQVESVILAQHSVWIKLLTQGIERSGKKTVNL